MPDILSFAWMGDELRRPQRVTSHLKDSLRSEANLSEEHVLAIQMSNNHYLYGNQMLHREKYG